MGYSKEEIQKARQTDLLSYLERQNQIARSEGRVEPYVIVKEGKQYRIEGYSGLLVTGNMWNQRSTNIGGNTLDFLIKFEGKTFNEAMQILLNEERFERVNVVKKDQRPKEPFIMPQRNDSFRRVIAYLTKTRGLDAQICLEEIKKENIFEDKDHHNAVFVGRDAKGEPRWAQKRSTLTNYKTVLDQAGSDPRYPYFYGDKNANFVIVTEAPIEALSYATLLKIHGKDPSKAAILALGGVHDTALEQYLRDNPHVKTILTALNNDRATKPNEIKGHEASQMIKQKYSARGYHVRSVFPKNKDWNDDLRAIREKEKEKNLDPENDLDIEKQIKAYQKHKAKQRAEARSRTRIPGKS
jgi:hypothetical protein